MVDNHVGARAAHPDAGCVRGGAVLDALATQARVLWALETETISLPAPFWIAARIVATAPSTMDMMERNSPSEMGVIFDSTTTPLDNWIPY